MMRMSKSGFAVRSVVGTVVSQRFQEVDMRVMVLVKATKESEAGLMPSAELMTAMGRFNDELGRAGILEAAAGLKPSSQGVRVRFSGTSRTLFDGPFAETKELVAGYWIWNVGSLEEAIAWVRRCPNPMTSESDIEIRPLFGMEDFGEALTPEARALHEGALPCRKEH
jgi:hypothetical protein